MVDNNVLVTHSNASIQTKFKPARDVVGLKLGFTYELASDQSIGKLVPGDRADVEFANTFLPLDLQWYPQGW